MTKDKQIEMAALYGHFLISIAKTIDNYKYSFNPIYGEDVFSCMRYNDYRFFEGRNGEKRYTWEDKDIYQLMVKIGFDNAIKTFDGTRKFLSKIEEAFKDFKDLEFIIDTPGGEKEFEHDISGFVYIYFIQKDFLKKITSPNDPLFKSLNALNKFSL